MYRLRTIINTSVCKRLLHHFSLKSLFTQCFCSCGQRSKAAAKPRLCEMLRSCQGMGGSSPSTGGGSQPTVGGGITGGGLPLECVLLQRLANPPRASLGDGDRPSMCQGPQLACLPSQFLTSHNRSSLMPKTDREITELSRARPPPLWRGPHGAS